MYFSRQIPWQTLTKRRLMPPERPLLPAGGAVVLSGEADGGGEIEAATAESLGADKYVFAAFFGAGIGLAFHPGQGPGERLGRSPSGQRRSVRCRSYCVTPKTSDRRIRP